MPMERLKVTVTGTDLQSPIAVTSEYINHKVFHTESEPFNNTQKGESVYKRRKFVEVVRQELALPGGAIAGIGLRIVADTNLHTLEDYYQKPEFFLGVTLVGVGAMMVKRALDAVDKYDVAGESLDRVKKWRNSFKAKEEKIVYQKSMLPVQLTLDEAPVQATYSANVQEQMGSQGLLKKITTDRPIERLRQAMEEQKASVLEANEKTSKSTIVPEPAKRKRVRARVKASKIEISPKEKSRRRASRASVPRVKVEQVSQKNTDEKKDIGKQIEFRSYMTKKNNEELKALGFIPYHKCLENECWVCRKSNPIFI